MAPYPYGSGPESTGWTADGLSHCPSDIDGLLAGAGYRVRSSDLRHVAQNLERLDCVMVASDDGRGVVDDYLASGPVHYNPTDLTSWVDSMLSELGPPTAIDPPQRQIEGGAWPDQMYAPPPPQMAVVAAVARQQMEEDSGIRLVHLLMSCGDAVQQGDAALASTLLDEMRVLLARVNTACGIGKVAGYFVDALIRRLYSPAAAAGGSPVENEILYHHYYEACPYLKFAHFTANQAILEAFEGHDRVHVVDFSLMHGLQWPALIQALALRPGGPPFLRITGIGPPSPDGRDTLREIGLRLAELARSVHVRFAFRGVAATRLDDVRPWMLQVATGEALAINSVLQLHRLLGDPGRDAAAPIESVLGWVSGLKPKIVTVVEQEADHNKPEFLDRFTEALFYYSTMFDSLEGGRGSGAPGGGAAAQQAALAEVYLQRELCNVVCCEGDARVERHEPLARWRDRLGRAGLRAVHLGSNAFKQARMLLTLFSGEGYCVEEVDGCLTLGWHSRHLISASAWTAGDGVGNSTPLNFDVPRGENAMVVENQSGSSSSSGGNNSEHPQQQQRIIIGNIMM